MREAPSLILIDKIITAGGKVKVYDPIAIEECQRRIGNKVTYGTDMYDAALDADALLLVTEWREFRFPNFTILGKVMKEKVIIDGRNIYDRQDLVTQGFTYCAIGK
jgi:UDPglucose 6-dehydrogenase